ncbi:hypothetical protein BYT27DRAFT_6748988 [Phlegmacium glaucopus]|nr:hypothetical protein BYT27DRAFT_6748988 [Phlegmacium glaucopus]
MDHTFRFSMDLKSISSFHVISHILDLTPSACVASFSGSDSGPGTMVASGSPHNPLLNKCIFLMPCWEKDPHAPRVEDATEFLAGHRIVPVVSHVLDGLESAEEGFELLKRGDQFAHFYKFHDSIVLAMWFILKGHQTACYCCGEDFL